MSLKQKIGDAYKKYEQCMREYTKYIVPQSSNFLAVSLRIRQLKTDLCKFADNFDKNFVGTIATPLTEEIIDKIYKDIRDDFVERIAEENNNFIYGIEKERGVEEKRTRSDIIKLYSKSMQKFNSGHRNLKADFVKATDLIAFFEQQYLEYYFSNNIWASEYMSCWDETNTHICDANEQSEHFIASVFKAMAEELYKKNKILIAKDSEYFEVIPDIKEVAKEPDMLNRIIDLFKVEVEKVINDEETQKLTPALIQKLKYQLKAADELKSKPDLTPEELKKLETIMGISIDKFNADMGIEKHVIGSVADTVKIFPNGKPLTKEVNQAAVQDCYLMSTLISLARTNPKAIAQCFVQSPDDLTKLDSLDDITIRFFHVKGIPSLAEKVLFGSYIEIETVKIVVNKKRVINSQDIKYNALWPKLIEKAYAVYRKKYMNKQNLNFGQSYDSMFAITGKSVGVIGEGGDKIRFDRAAVTSQSPIMKQIKENIIDIIKKKLKKHRTLVCAFKKNFTTTDAKNHEEIPILNKHSYAIKDVNDSKKYIKLVEPHRKIGRTYSSRPVNFDRPEPPKEGGNIAMPFEDFENNFLEITYTTEEDF